MKNRIKYLLIVLIFIGLCTPSCFEDKGNYEYIDLATLMPVTISGLRDTTIIRLSNLKIVPELRNVDREYAYCWFVTERSTEGFNPVKRVISNERDLDIVMSLPLGDYTLYFEVIDKDRDIFIQAQAALSVTETDIITGWYVLKDDGYETDFDYIRPTGEVVSDLLQLSGDRLKGTAVQIVDQPWRYVVRVIHPDGTAEVLRNQQALHILSSEEIKTFNARSWQLFRNFEDMFYVVPETCQPQSMYVEMGARSGNVFFVNDGTVYTISGEAENFGMYGTARIGHYYMHADFIASMNAGLFFDTMSRSFYSASLFSGASLDLLPNDYYGMPPEMFGWPSVVNMDYTMVAFLPSSNQVAFSYGVTVMKSIYNDEYYIGEVEFWDPMMGMSVYPFTSWNQVPAGCKMPLSPVKAAPAFGSFLFFGDGNKLCVYKNDTGFGSDPEEVLVTLPAGETISYITNAYNDQLVVLTNSAAGWKMYGFSPITGIPELVSTTPVFTYSGIGNARQVIYRNE